MRFLLISLLSAGIVGAQCTPVDGRGNCITGLTAIQNNLLGPLTPSGTSLWIYGDLIEKAVIDYMAPKGVAESPESMLGAALSGTFTWSQGDLYYTTSVDQTTPLATQAWIVIEWTTVDGAGTGRSICQVGMVTSTRVYCGYYMIPIPSGTATAYRLSASAFPSGFNFYGWAPQNGGGVSVTWNYYDVAIGFFKYFYRNLTSTYQTYARQYADIQWNWTLDHGYDAVAPRVASMISQFFRVTEGHTERLPGLYAYIGTIQAAYGDTTSCFAALAICDVRESGYTLWDVALGAKVDTDPTRHNQYCTWLATDTLPWTTNQYPDGHWGENLFGVNSSYPSAPRNYTDSPLQFSGSPWRIFAAIKGLQAAYESLSDTTTQGCNNSGANNALAAAALTAVTNAVPWINNYGRDPTNRGMWYTEGSASCEQPGSPCNATYPGNGTVDINTGTTSLTGHSTTWQTDGDCDGTHYIGIGSNADNPRGVYKIASCSSNTAATLSVNFGKFGESSVTGKTISFAPSSSSSCSTSSSTECYGGAGTGDRNLTRTNCGAMGWLYAHTLNSTHLAWADECESATLGGPTAGPTSAATIDAMTLPCSGPACDGYVNDLSNFLPNCSTVSNVPPCLNGTVPYDHLGKDFGECFGAPGCDNELAWRNWALPLVTGPANITGRGAVTGAGSVK